MVIKTKMSECKDLDEVADQALLSTEVLEDTDCALTADFQHICMSVLQKVLSLGSDYFSATFYQTYFYYKPSKYSPFTETHFCNLFTQSQKADKQSSFGICWRH